MRGWLKHLRNRLIDKLARWVWEGLCRLELDLRETGKQLSLVRLQVGKTEGGLHEGLGSSWKGLSLREFLAQE